MAKETHQRASDLVGITCRYCAYCFDEALQTRVWIQQEKQREAEQGENVIQLHQQRMRGEPAGVPIHSINP